MRPIRKRCRRSAVPPQSMRIPASNVHWPHAASFSRLGERGQFPVLYTNPTILGTDPFFLFTDFAHRFGIVGDDVRSPICNWTANTRSSWTSKAVSTLRCATAVHEDFERSLAPWPLLFLGRCSPDVVPQLCEKMGESTN